MRRPARIVILGAGFAGLHAAFALRHAVPTAAITLVAREDCFLYQPDLVYVPFGLDLDGLKVPLQEPLQKQNIDFLHASVNHVDVAQRLVTAGGHTVPYDDLLIATGARPRWDRPGLELLGRNIASTAGMVALRQDLERLVPEARNGQPRNILLVAPPGALLTGPLYETALLIDTWLSQCGSRKFSHIAVATWEPAVLHTLGRDVQRTLARSLTEQRVAVHTSWMVKAVEPGVVHSIKGEELQYHVLVASPPLQGSLVVPDLHSDANGFIRTDVATRHAEGQSHIFVAGDAAADQPLKQAYLAFAQADVAAHFIACDITGEIPSRYYEPRARFILDSLETGLLVDSPVGDEPATVSQSGLWHLSKRLLGHLIPWQVHAGEPFRHLFETSPAEYPR